MVTRANKGWSQRLRRKIESEMPQKTETAMMKVESEVKRIIYLGHEQGHLNRKTGNLSRSITTESYVETDGTIVATTGTNSEYAATHEFGDTREVVVNGKSHIIHIPERSYLRPGFAAKKDAVKNEVDAAVRKIIDEVCL